MTTTHRVSTIGMTIVLLLATSAPPSSAKLSDLLPGSSAQKAAIKCVRTIQKESARYASGHMKLLIKCKAAVVKGAGGSLAVCDPLTGDFATKDANNAQRLADKIAARCAGDDRICGTAADVPLADINWDIGTCPFLLGSGPGNTIGDCGDIADCLAPTIRQANHRVANEVGADLFDAALFGAGTEPAKARNKCQQAAFKALTKFYLTQSRTLLKCWTAKTKRKGDDFDDADPCPDTDVEKGKTSAAIEKATRKLASTICKRCGGDGDADKDGTCDTPDAPVDFLSAPFLCPNVVVPGSSGPGGVTHFFDDDAEPANGVRCLLMGDPLVDTVQEYANCLACVGEFNADCAAQLPNGIDFALGLDLSPDCQFQPECGDGVLDPGEACDFNAPVPTCPNAGNGLQVCNLDCTCSCPGTMTFTPDANDPATRIDLGWAGWAHDVPFIDQATVALALSGGDAGVPGQRDPTCGVMDLGGPIQNPAAGAGQPDIVRCSASAEIACVADSDCPPTETCATFAGPPFPMSAGGFGLCLTSRFVGPITGTVDIESGEMASRVAVVADVAVGVQLDRPCNVCVGDLTANDGSPDGLCDAGPRIGLPCDVMGISPFAAFNAGTPAGGTINGSSFDCPAGLIGIGSAFELRSSTATESLTVQATGPTCTAAGTAGLTCMCDTCATPDAEPCNADSDCPASIRCGGLRCLDLDGPTNGMPCTTLGLDPICGGVPCGQLGEPTRPNTCIGGMCVGGACPAGPFDGRCGPAETFRGCLAPSDCPFPGDSCVFAAQPCFDDNGSVGGTIQVTGLPDVPSNDVFEPTLASAFCMGPTVAALFNGALSLPGPAQTTMRGTVHFSP